MIVISPHLDDALLSVYATITGHTEQSSRVVTVLAGEPPDWYWPTPFDSLCGFGSSRSAVRARQAEDLEANRRAMLCEPWHLPFRDGQYRIPPAWEELVEALHPYVGAMMAPLGLVHPDHLLVADACAAALNMHLEAAGASSFTLYADLPSAHLYPETIEPAVNRWRGQGWHLSGPTRLYLTNGEIGRKDEVLAAYASQRRLPELGIQNLNVETTWIATRAD